MTYRVGLIGCGWIAPYQIEGWRLLPNVEVVAVCDQDGRKAAQLASRFGIRQYGEDPERMMDTANLDIVDIATPPDSHNELTLAAVERGLHVLCQKPAAPTEAQAEEMISAARARGVALYINEMLRFCPWFLRAQDLIQQGAIGRPVYARLFSRTAAFIEVGPARRVAYGFREFLKTAERILMIEETIHYFDVIRFLFGNPSSIYAVAQKVSPLLRGEDMASVILRYSDRTAVIEDSWSSHGPDRSGLELEGEDGAIIVSHSKRVELHSGRTGQVEQVWELGGRPWPEQRPAVFAALFRDFLRLIEHVPERTAQAVDNLQTLRMALAAYQSAERGIVVSL